MMSLLGVGVGILVLQAVVINILLTIFVIKLWKNMIDDYAIDLPDPVEYDGWAPKEEAVELQKNMDGYSEEDPDDEDTE